MKIILSAALAFLLLGCTDDATTKTATKEISKQAHETANIVTKSTEAVMQKAKEATAVVAEQVKAVSEATVVQVKEVSADIAKQAEEPPKAAEEKKAQETASR